MYIYIFFNFNLCFDERIFVPSLVLVEQSVGSNTNNA